MITASMCGFYVDVIRAGWRSDSFRLADHPHRGVCKFRTRCHGSASSRSLARCRIRSSSSEMAVPRVRGINPSRLTCWNEPDGDGLCHDGALVSDDVHVLATVVNKRHPC